MAEITTTKTMKGPQGQYCVQCKVRKPVGRLGGRGFICTDCDPQPLLVEEVKDDAAK